jgi:hypothetical protein
MSGLFDRHGHLLELGAYRLVQGECSPTEEAEAQAHLEGCALCQERMALSREQVGAALPPMPALPETAAPEPSPAVAEVVPLRPRRAPWIAAAGGVMALAAAALITFRPAPDEVYTTRGGPDWFQLYRSDGDVVTRVSTGETVAPGDRIGFSVDPGEAGAHVLIFGLDSTGALYPAWPGGNTPAAGWLPGAEEPVDLALAILLDDTPGTEHIVALACQEPLAWGALEAALEPHRPVPDADLPRLLPECEQAEHRLTKASP